MSVGNTNKNYATTSFEKKAAVEIRLNYWTLGLSLICFLVILGLSGMAVYNLTEGNLKLLSNNANTSFGELRESQQQKLIRINEQKLLQLKDENIKQQNHLTEIEIEFNTLITQTNQLQNLATQINQKITPDKDASTSSAIIITNSTYTSAEAEAKNIATYNTEFSRLSTNLEELGKNLQNGRYNLSTINIQIQNYQATLLQQNLAGISSAQLNQLSGFKQAETGADPQAPRTVPVNGLVTSLFGIRWSPFVSGVRQMHYGLDLACPEGTPVLTTKNGVVSYVGYDSGYGNRVEITHSGGWLTLYAHNNKILVKVGQVVKQGEVIALSGNTGASTGPHSHYEVHFNGLAIDPLKVITTPLKYQ